MWKQKKAEVKPEPLLMINDMGLYKAYKRINNPEKKNSFMSERERAEIIRLHKQGLTQTRISIEVGRSQVSINKVLCEEGLTVGKKGNYRKDITIEMVVELREKGLTHRDIAKKLGCSDQLVRTRIQQAMRERRKNDTHNSDSDIRSDSDRGAFCG